MRLKWPLLLLLGFVWLSCFPKVEGFKCYVCELDDCNPEVSDTEKFLVDCGDQGVIGCGSFSVKTNDPYNIEPQEEHVEDWFQRICLYQVDLVCLGLQPADISSGQKLWNLMAKSPVFVDFVSCMNTNRKEKGHLLINEPPVDALVREGVPSDNMYLRFCEGENCNKFLDPVKRRVPITLAEGFPMDIHNKRKRDSSDITSCYRCTDEGNCKVFIRSKELSNGAYGCKMLAIYQIAGGMNKKDHFERGIWYPGDQWCLERSYNSTPIETGRSLGNVKKANIQYLKGGSSGRGARCSNDEYSRALTGRELDSGFEWIGHRKFYSPEEFSDYWNCRKHVTNKLKILARRANPLKPFDKTAAAAEWSGKSGVFAWVGFRFCGPENLCNSWTEAELYEKMKPENPPSTSTTLKPGSSTTLPQPSPATPTPTGGKDDDGCYKDTKNNKAPKIIGSFSTCFFLFAFLQAG